MFERIQEVLKPQAPTDKYAGTYVGKSNLATIKEGQELQGLFLQKKGNRPIRGCQLLAKNMVYGQERYVSIEEMLNAGFPTNKPIDLKLEIEQGSDRPTGDDIGGEDRNPASTNGQILLDVFANCVNIVRLGVDAGCERMLNEVDTAARYTRPVAAQSFGMGEDVAPDAPPPATEPIPDLPLVDAAPVLEDPLIPPPPPADHSDEDKKHKSKAKS